MREDRKIINIILILALILGMQTGLFAWGNTVPGAPEDVALLPNIDRLTLRWNDPESESPIGRYEIQIDSGSWQNIGLPAITSDMRTHVIPGLTGGVQYTISLRAVDVNGGQGPVWTGTGTPDKRYTVTGFDAEITAIQNQPLYDIIADGRGTSWANPIRATVKINADTPAVGIAQISVSEDATATMFTIWDHPDSPYQTITTRRVFDPESDSVQRLFVRVVSSNYQTTLYYLITIEFTRPGLPVDFMMAPCIEGFEMQWRDPVTGPSVYYYEIQVNGGSWQNIGMPALSGGLRTYTITGLTGGEEHTVSIRAAGISGPGEKVTLKGTTLIKNTLSDTITINAVSGDKYNVTVSVKNIKSFEGLEIELKYDGSVFDIVDLCKFTKQEERAAGRIKDTDITITHVSQGEIKFTVDKPIGAGQAYSGTVNVVTFQAKKSGTSTIEISN